MKQQEYLKQWLESDGEQAPVLLTGGTARMVRDTVANLGGQGDEMAVLKPEKSTISIKELRGWLRSLSLTSWTGKRLAVLEQAEKLSLPAANALLKSLEEASGSTRFILTTRWPMRMLGTIRSRCQTVSLGVGDELKNSEDEVDRLAWGLGQQLREEGPSRELTRAFMRLRDYYQIRSLLGNEKLAREVLFASLPNLGKM